MRNAGVAALLCGAWAVAGCGATGVTPSQQVQSTLQRFAHAVAARDTATLCRSVLAPSLVARVTAIGVSCPVAMTTFIGTTTDPTLQTVRVRVSRDTASALVILGARGEPGSRETVSLARSAGTWRMTSLVSPR